MTKKKTIFLIIGIIGPSIIFIVSLFLPQIFQNDSKFQNDPKEVKAGATNNVFGFAWAGVPQASGEKLGLGWISFNCNSPELPSPRCSQTNYGVNIEADGNLSGYAYFDMNDPNTPEHEVGWIDFNPLGPYPSCPPSTCPDGSPNYSARIDLNGSWRGDVTKKPVVGWAKALNYGGGWDGWILLGPIVKNGTDYGAYLDTQTQEFRGWAWGDSVVGWISFNCNNRDICSQSNYKVYTTFTFAFNQPPIVTDMNVDAQGPDNYCGIGPGLGVVNFSWTYNDQDRDPETRFDLQVDNNSDFSSPEVNRSYSDLNNPSGTINSQLVSVKNTPTAPGGDYLTYNTRYYWRVKVYDNQRNDSGWIEGSSFITTTHPWPWPEFTWSPEKPTVNEVVSFTDQSQVFGGATITNWSWTFAPDGNPHTSSQQNPEVIFPSDGDKVVILEVTDSSNYTCSREETINMGLPLPEIIEIPPRVPEIIEIPSR
ncbi:MAG: PKD domain-containing protein [Candidatus Pacebacteria bacterium]|nr:PKD domain-containing protein [Candidatus Paceibacterota bacterium]